jgi:hypothetical protein
MVERETASARDMYAAKGFCPAALSFVLHLYVPAGTAVVVPHPQCAEVAHFTIFIFAGKCYTRGIFVVSI